LLESPAGNRMVIMSDVANATEVTDVTVTMDDDAPNFMPIVGPFVEPSYKPTDNNLVDQDTFPLPAPQPPYAVAGPAGNDTLTGTFLQVPFNELNGNWRLWIVDDADFERGLLQSWEITFIFAALPCLHADTLVKVPHGIKKISEIKAGDFVIDHKGVRTLVVYNMLFPSTRKFIEIPKKCLGNNLPTHTLHIRKGHPILLNNEEILPEALQSCNINVMPVSLKKPSIVYSLCTHKRTFVNMNGVDVATWEQRDWEENASRNYVKYIKQ
jgi:hypothetical protein